MFKFKQFTIHQDRSAMKVCTDSCLFGALINADNAKRALDIGAGTGLLSLMLAQRYSQLEIDAVEIDSGAAQDARDNIKSSKFFKQIHLYHCAVQTFSTEIAQKYDLIFSNPPFYQNQLASPNVEKNVAHHATDLRFEELLSVIIKLLNACGNFWILLPPFEMNIFRSMAEKVNLYPQQIIKVKNYSHKPVFREILRFSFSQPSKITEHHMNIYEKDAYSGIFTNLLKDYYLKL